MNLAQGISVALASMPKFIGGSVAGAAFGLSWVETGLWSAVGMMATVTLVTFFKEALTPLARRLRRKPRRLFTRRTRFAVKVYGRAGIIGIALLTPTMLTPAGGTLIALSFKVRRGPMFAAMTGSAVFWGFIYAYIIGLTPGLVGL